MTEKEQLKLYTSIFLTVPINEPKMERTSDNKKTKVTFKHHWSSTKPRNTDATPLLGAIASKDFIGIDIDNNVLYRKALNFITDITPCDYIAQSMPLEANKGGHLLFSYHEDDYRILKMLQPLAKKSNIDIQLHEQLIYLATPANKTKMLLTPPLTQLPQHRVPQELTQWIASTILFRNLSQGYVFTDKVQTYTSEYMEAASYGYLLEGTLTPDIVKELTPKRDFPNIIEMDDIPQGEGTEWMLQVRKKLQIDKTTGPEAFLQTMHYLNELWSDPMPQNRVDIDCRRDIESLDWVYDKNWKMKGLTFPNKFNHAIEVLFDHERKTYITFNHTTKDVKLYDTQTSLLAAIQVTSATRIKMTGANVLKLVEPITIVNSPEYVPYKTESSSSEALFNLYTPSEGTQILKGLMDVQDYRHPKHILAFLKNLLVNPENRNKFLGFIAHKHRTYEHSPLYFVMAGVGGAGKGVIVNVILSYFSSPERIYSADLHKLSNSFNSWMATTDYMEIEEAGEGASLAQQAQMVANLKKLTGKRVLTIESKGKDIQAPQRHYITPIISTNMNTKLITDTAKNDRRLVLFRCPNKLSKITDDEREFIHQMMLELPSFAHYLREFSISHTDYHDNKNWKDDDYSAYIEDTTTHNDKLLAAAEDKDLNAFINELKEIGIPYETIDSMFSLSLDGKDARALLYNTSGTRELNIKALQDVAENTPVLDSNIKQKFTSIKQKRSYRHGNGSNYTLQVIEFNTPYTNLTNRVEIISNDSVDLS